MIETISLQTVTERARSAATGLAILPTSHKNSVLGEIAGGLQRHAESLLAANGADMDEARASGMGSALLDRLELTAGRIEVMAADVRRVATLPDPVGEEFDARSLPNGLRLSRRRVPLGVIGVIYEARPNVTIDVSALCLKSGNASILRGGKEARRSNAALARVVRAALTETGAPEDAVQLIDNPDRALVGEMVRARGAIDLIVPRGGSGLIEYVREHAQVPVVAGGIGVCHTYVHHDAQLDMAVDIVDNAKTRRPTVCNALDTILVHSDIAPAFLPGLIQRWDEAGVEMRCCPRALAIARAAGASRNAIPADASDFGQEFLALRAAVKLVDSLDDAVRHIEEYGSGHSEAIVTEGYTAAGEFVNRIDAAAVYVNASTQFTDGSQFGLGAELGISTQKFHARGPLGLTELTSYKWVALGNGQIRPN